MPSRMTPPDALLRALIAIPGAYAAACLAGMAIARHLPADRADAATAGMLAALVLCPAGVIAGFACRSARQTATLTALLCAGLAIAACAGARTFPAAPP